MLTSRTADAELGARVFFKCENFQRMGAFKFRGAYNALARFDERQRRAGRRRLLVGQPRAGDLARGDAARHAGGDRHAARRAGRQGGGDEGLRRQRRRLRPLSRGPRGDRQEARRGARHDADPAVRPSRRHRRPGHRGEGADRGGRRRSTRSSSASAAAACSPARRSQRARSRRRAGSIGVEPEAGNDGQQSFRSGRIVTIETPRTIADGAQTLHLGEHTFPIIRRDVADIFTATDAELVEAMRFFAERMKMVVEPTGTLGFAAARRIGRPSCRPSASAS